MALQISVSLKLNTAIMGARRNFFRGGQSRPFAYPLQVVDDATQMDAHKTLHSFYTTKQRPIVTAIVACSVFPLRKFYTKKLFVLVSMDILRLS